LQGESLDIIGDTEQMVSAAALEVAQRGYHVGQLLVLDFAQAAVHHGNAQLFVHDSSASRPLWLPSPVVLQEIDAIEERLLQQLDTSSSTTAALPQFCAIDLACGCGRDVVFLAKRPHWRVSIGIDYLEQQLEAVRSLADREQVAERVKVLQHDLEKDGLPCASVLRELVSATATTTTTTTSAPSSETTLATTASSHYQLFDLVTVARYLHRPLLPHLYSLIRPGGFLVYHTFMKGCESTQVGRPKRPQFLLQPDELRSVFGEQLGMEIIVDRVDTIHDGRPTSFFVARKPVQ
jgi:tellurite methyltransferase